VSVVRCWWQGCRDLCEERLGVPHARHGWFQLAPVAPPQGTAEPRRQDGGTSGKMCFKQGKTLPGRVRAKRERSSP